MNRYQVSEHFHLDEFVDLYTYNYYAQKGTLHRLASKFSNTIEMAENVRVLMDEPAVINNWWKTFAANDFDVRDTNRAVESSSSLRQWSGYRAPNTPYYSKDSQHSVFNAVDMIFTSNGWLEKARTIVRGNWEELGIRAMEVGNSWLHIDTRFIYDQTHLFEFNP